MNEKPEFTFKIENSSFSHKNPLIIAELGTSHNANIAKAKEMTHAAMESGANCVKFQMVFADEILHPNTGYVALPGGKIRLYDRFKALETPVEFYEEIKDYVESMGLLFLCTPFGIKSAEILRSIKPKVVKIASPELNFTSLLEEIAGWEMPVLLSSGVSMLGDIERAVDVFRKKFAQRHSGTEKEKEILPRSSQSFTEEEKDIGQKTPCHSVPSVVENSSKLCLLHCVTSYPAPETDYNLRVLPSLASVFGVSVGVSDHSSDPELVPALAVSMGAAVIEKHFCLSRSDPGLDDPIALPPDDFAKMSRAIRSATEAGTDETLEHYIQERGSELVEKILGSGVKELAPSEKANYRYTNRSIHALRDIAAGEVLKKSDYAVLRTEKNLRPGLEPYWEKELEGRATRNFILAGEGIRFEDV